ncbi:Amidophosphoribosyltransferase [Hypsibius exemplaris]|uniref:Amidophosphoribosyltransferase n=1 Tax=Hypsibius exemplaris TaxID=2072580 RepID=A0A1W0WD44_HYPEX|nr:Amidophosphoribosyltransferase [Hypsibius exemplaris]
MGDNSDPVSGTGMREECAVFGCIAGGPWPNPDVNVAEIIFNGLVGLQHRGQESSGIVTGSGDDKSCRHVREQFVSGQKGLGENVFCKEPQCEPDSTKIRAKKAMGMVNTAFKDEDMRYLKGNLGLGHNRYSTAGRSDLINCQPLLLYTKFGEIAIAHNGEVVNQKSLRNSIFRHGGTFTADSDTEMIVRALLLMPGIDEQESPMTPTPTALNGHGPCEANKCSSPTKSCSNKGDGRLSRSISEDAGEPDWAKRIVALMGQYPLAYSFCLMHKDSIYAVRDCFGNRPLVLGKVPGLYDPEKVDAWIVASETCCFKDVGCKAIGEVLPGEIVKITRNGIESVARAPPKLHVSRKLTTAFCVFEYVYFARGDTFFEGQQVYSVRERCGRQLAKESWVEADIVSNVPDSATAAALGFSAESGIPYKEVLIKNPYVGRTFIQPSNRLRQLAVSKKFGALAENFAGKRIIIVDDSIVRGNTLQAIVKLLRDAGAKEVHVRAACPPVRNPCYMGINIPTRKELIANQMTVEEMPAFFGADSVSYLSIEGLRTAVEQGIKENPRETNEGEWAQVNKKGHCVACLTGEYPVTVQEELDW